jgi:iron complex transport system permease protein
MPKELSHDPRYGKRIRLIFSCLLLLVIIFLILDIFLGSVSIKASEVIRAIFNNTGGNYETIILKFRFPKAITALTVGVALSLSGLQMQTVFRNPMAGLLLY